MRRRSPGYWGRTDGQTRALWSPPRLHCAGCAWTDCPRGHSDCLWDRLGIRDALLCDRADDPTASLWSRWKVTHPWGGLSRTAPVWLPERLGLLGVLGWRTSGPKPQTLCPPSRGLGGFPGVSERLWVRFPQPTMAPWGFRVCSALRPSAVSLPAGSHGMGAWRPCRASTRHWEEVRRPLGPLVLDERSDPGMHRGPPECVLSGTREACSWRGRAGQNPRSAA